MKKTIMICVALIFGYASTSYSIPVSPDYSASRDTGSLSLNASIIPMNFTLNQNTSVSFESIASGPRLDLNSASSSAITRWTPNWLNRPDSGNYKYDLVSNFTLSSKYDTSRNTNPVPEPATILLLGSGLVGLACIGRKRMKS